MLIFTDIKFSHPCLSTTLAMSMTSCGFILSFYVFLSCPLPVSCTLSCITKCQNAVKYFGVRLIRFQWAVGKDRHRSSSTPTNLTSHQGMRSITEELYPEWEQQQCCFLSLSCCEVQVLITPLLMKLKKCCLHSLHWLESHKSCTHDLSSAKWTSLPQFPYLPLKAGDHMRISEVSLNSHRWKTHQKLEKPSLLTLLHRDTQYSGQIYHYTREVWFLRTKQKN